MAEEGTNPEVALEKSLVLELDPDMMHASLVCVRSDTPDSFLTLEAARSALSAANVTCGLDMEMVKETCQRIESMTEGERVRIAEGTEPVHGKDGDIQFAIDVSGHATYEGGGGSDERIDFKSATRIASVKPGDLLATHIPPTVGTPGMTIRGKQLPPRKTRDTNIRIGQNVERNPETDTFHATAHGRPIYFDNTLQVLPVYQVAGDVDYTTGHIKFAGSVIVEGNVQDDFNITARDIVVSGTVGASTLTAEGSITIHGGINGKDKGLLKAGGEVAAKYVNNATIEAIRDITVLREIVHSRIMTNGRLRTGNLIGGHTSARLGVEVNILGSDLGVATRVEPGADINILKIESALNLIDAKIETLLKPVLLLLGDRAKFKALPDEKKEEYRALYPQFCSLQQAHLQLAERRTEILNATAQLPCKEVVVLKMLHQDTIIATDLCMKNFSKAATGPLVVVEDIDRGSMAVKPYSERQTFATDTA